MGPGLPGFGIASLFYVAAGLLAPIREVALTVLGRSSRQRWRKVGLQFTLSVATVAAVLAFLVGVDQLIAVGLLSVARGPRALAGIPNFVYAVVAFVLVLGASHVVGAIYARSTQPEASAIVAARHRLGRLRTATAADHPTNEMVQPSEAHRLVRPLDAYRSGAAFWPEVTPQGLPTMTIRAEVWRSSSECWGGRRPDRDSR